MEERERTRARSSRDFHDETGNRLTKISLYTGLLQQQLPQEGQTKEFLAQIESHVRHLASGMLDFTWVLDPQQDQLSDILGRLSQFGDQLFADTGISFQWQQRLSQDFWAQSLDVNSKRHLLMIFKEGMHNALKYSQATQVTLSVSETSGGLLFALQDDGLGFEQDELVRVNGLHNMESRATDMSATLEVQWVPGMGTSILLRTEIHLDGQ